MSTSFRLNKAGAKVAFYDALRQSKFSRGDALTPDEGKYRTNIAPGARFAGTENKALKTEMSLGALLLLPDKDVLSVIRAVRQSNRGPQDGVLLCTLPDGSGQRADITTLLDPNGKPFRLTGEYIGRPWMLDVAVVPDSIDLVLRQTGGVESPTDLVVPTIDMTKLKLDPLPFEWWAPASAAVAQLVHRPEHIA